VLDRPGGDLSAGIEAEPVEDALHVAFGRPFRDHQSRRDFSIGQSLSDESRHLAFTRRQQGARKPRLAHGFGVLW